MLKPEIDIRNGMIDVWINSPLTAKETLDLAERLVNVAKSVLDKKENAPRARAATENTALN